MRNPVTFFRDRDSERGQVHPEHPGQEAVATAYTHRPADTRMPPPPPSHMNDQHAYTNQLARWLEDNGGGVAAFVHESHGHRLAHVIRVKGSGYEPPESFLLLKALGFATQMRLKEPPRAAELKIDRADHLVLPATAEDQERLANLLSTLSCFPADVQALVLNVIRRPSLDARIDEILDHVSGRSSLLSRLRRRLARSAARSGATGQLPNPLMPILITSGLLILILGLISIVPLERGGTLLTMGIERLLDQENRSTDSDRAAGKRRQGGSGQLQSSETGADQATELSTARDQDQIDPEALRQELYALADVLSRSETGRLGSVFNNHLRKGRADVDRAFQGDQPSRQLLAWAMLKLVLLNSDPSIEASAVLSRKARSRTKKELIRLLPNLRRSELALIAYLNCQSYGTPDVPAIRGDSLPARVRLPISTCASLSSKDVVAAIERLRIAAAKKLTEDRQAPAANDAGQTEAESAGPS